jgi:geranylgeranylglycerol-phosphate geranylgeranyltransferase
VSGEIFFSDRIFIAALSAGFIAAYGNIVNDLFDYGVDLTSKPNRPLVRGLVGKLEAAGAATVFGAAGFVLSFKVGDGASLIAIWAIILLFMYTPFLKGIPFVGNITVALVASMAFIYGGIAVGRPAAPGALILALFAFLMHLGREIVKDIEDRRADFEYGIRTVATYFDAKMARLAAIAVFVALIIATFIPVATGLYGAGYFLVVVAGADFFLVESAHQLASTKNEADMRRIATWLKIAMPFGLLAVLLGHLGW